MPQISRRARRIAAGVVLFVTLGLASSCGPGEGGFATLEIEEARWQGESIVVTGRWIKGISTPPLCRVIEGRDGPASERFDADPRVDLDGNTFFKEFTPVELARETPPSKPRGSYYIRCTVSLDSGRSSEDAARVAGHL